MSWAAVAGAGISAAGSLIGGAQGGGTTTSKLPRHLRNLGRNILAPNAEEFGEQYGSGEGLFSGSRLGDQDPLVAQGENQALRAAGQIGQGFSGANQALEGFLDVDYNSPQNQAQREALGANVSSIFNESIRPGIEDRSTFSGQFGGPQSAVAMGSATAPLSRAIADSEVSMFNADQNRALQALGIAPGIISGQLLPSQITSSVGAGRTTRNQMEIQDMIQMFEADRNNALKGNQDAAGLLGLLSGGQGSVTDSGTRGNPMQAALGGALFGSQFGGKTTGVLPTSAPLSTAASTGNFMPQLDTSSIVSGMGG